MRSVTRNVSESCWHRSVRQARLWELSYSFVQLLFTTGISLQEAIYGTKLLARLEAIKEAIDPDYMFDCYKCIGNNRAKSKTTVEDDQSKEGEAQADIDGNADGDTGGDMNGEDSPEEAIAVSSSDGGCLSIRKFSFFTLLSFVGFFLV